MLLTVCILFPSFFFWIFHMGQLLITCSKLTRKTLEQGKICSKLKIKTPERRHWRRTDVFIVNFEHISHLVLRASWWCIIDKILVQMKPK